MALASAAAFFRKMKYHTIRIVLVAIVASALRSSATSVQRYNLGRICRRMEELWAYSLAYNDHISG
jgi:hypothetical protein